MSASGRRRIPSRTRRTYDDEALAALEGGDVAAMWALVGHAMDPGLQRALGDRIVESPDGLGDEDLRAALGEPTLTPRARVAVRVLDALLGGARRGHASALVERALAGGIDRFVAGALTELMVIHDALDQATLRSLSSHPQLEVRHRALAALGRDPEEHDRIAEQLATRPDDAAVAVAALRTSAVGRAHLLRLAQPSSTLSASSLPVATLAACALAAVGHGVHEDLLCAYAARALAPLRAAALTELGRRRSLRAFEPAIAGLAHEEPAVRRAALRALAELGDHMALPAMERLLDDPHQPDERLDPEAVRDVAAAAIAALRRKLDE